MKIDRKERFITKSRQLYGNKYDYSNVEYTNAHTKVAIICPQHGEFLITPNSHLNGCSCPVCGKNKKLTTEQFIEKAKQIHGNKYDYSKVDYINAHTKVCIICPEHGEFLITPSNHLRERGCPKCNSRKHLVNKYKVKEPMKVKKHTLESFIELSKKIHGDKYDYSKVEYKDNKTKVCIICPIHGEFWIRPDNFLRGQGCKKCGDLIRSENKKIFQEDWIKAASNLHNNKYDYSKVNYKNALTKVCIICPEHGEFWQKPSAHMQGQGCPICNESVLEREIATFLNNEEIEYEYRYHSKWLGNLELDFYLPKFNIAIECQGLQHFEPIEYFGGIDKFVKQVENDNIKFEMCCKENIELLYFSNLKKENMITSLNVLKEKIYKKNDGT
jgi:hypothetical protein